MTLNDIPVHDLTLRVNDIWYNQWFLLTCGEWDKRHFNTMTVAWGFFGIMWNKPVASVVVRPVRYTYQFMEQYDHFTLSAFPREYRKDLSHLGSVSGRDGDKIAGTRLTPAPASLMGSPSFEEAELIIECRKIYFDDFKPGNFIGQDIDKNYPQKDYHRIYFGEILKIRGIERYKKNL